MLTPYLFAALCVAAERERVRDVLDMEGLILIEQLNEWRKAQGTVSARSEAEGVPFTQRIRLQQMTISRSRLLNREVGADFYHVLYAEWVEAGKPKTAAGLRALKGR